MELEILSYLIYRSCFPQVLLSLVLHNSLLITLIKEVIKYSHNDTFVNNTSKQSTKGKMLVFHLSHSSGSKNAYPIEKIDHIILENSIKE